MHAAGAAVDDAPHGTTHFAMVDWLLWTRRYRKTQTEREFSRQKAKASEGTLLRDRVRFSSSPKTPLLVGSESDLISCESESVSLELNVAKETRVSL